MLDVCYQVKTSYLQLLELQVIGELNFFCKFTADNNFCCSQQEAQNWLLTTLLLQSFLGESYH